MPFEAPTYAHSGVASSKIAAAIIRQDVEIEQWSRAAGSGMSAQFRSTCTHAYRPRRSFATKTCILNHTEHDSWKTRERKLRTG